MIKLLLIVLGLVIGVSAVGYWYGTMNKEPLATTSLTPSPTVATQSSVLSSYQTCTNASKKFSIKYPSDWFTNKTGETCRFFGINSLVDEKTVLLTLNSSYTQKDFTDLKASLGRSDEERIVLSTSNIEIEGFNGQRVETEGTGSSDTAKGSRSVYYLIDNPSLPIVFSYTEKTAQPDRGNYVAILELMVSSLKYN